MLNLTEFSDKFKVISESVEQGKSVELIENAKEIKESYEEVVLNNTNLSKEMEKLKSDFEEIRKQNISLLFNTGVPSNLGTQNKDKEDKSKDNDKNKTLGIKDLFNEKGELK